MTAGVRIVDRDRGFLSLLARLERHALARLVVGVVERAGTERQDDSELSVLSVALIQEFGGGHLPERSFLRAWADTHRTENLARLRRAAVAVVRGADQERELRAIGQEMAGELRGFLAAGIDPPLGPAEAAVRGGSVPLVGGQLEAALGFEVRP